MANDLFRMVSLRHSKASRDGGPTPRRDPRLRYRSILKDQAKSAASESPREFNIFSCNIDFQQSEHNKSKSNDDERYETVAPAANLPNGANDPSGIVAISHKAGD